MSGNPRERGAALVLTLIFTTAMAALAVAFLAGRRSDALSLRGQLQAVEAQAALDAALHETLAVLANRKPRQIVPGQLDWRFGEVAVRVGIERESGKIDLNQARDPTLRGLALALGLDEDQAAAFSDTIQDWRDENKLRSEHGAEDAEYRSAGGPARGAANRPFADPAELRYLPPVDRKIWSLVAPYVTVYSGSGQPDAGQAAGPVRQALQIARGLQKSQGRNQGGDPAGGADDAGDGAQSQQAGAGLKGSAGQPSSLSAKDAGATSATLGSAAGGAAEDAGGGAGGPSGNGDDLGPVTVLLDVRFPNGYEAAAKAVVALTGGARGAAPYVVLNWAPVLRSQGEGS